MRAVADVVDDFQMPGSGIEGFARKSVQIALAGIYDLRIHRDEVLQPVLRHWEVFKLTGLNADGEAAREELGRPSGDLDRAASRFEEKRAARAARLALR